MSGSPDDWGYDDEEPTGGEWDRERTEKPGGDWDAPGSDGYLFGKQTEAPEINPRREFAKFVVWRIAGFAALVYGITQIPGCLEEKKRK